jgi:cellulose synthase/poly-beta-1,6-N-acetylglucosamine synthase-like glycosyltransferase
MVYLLAFLAGSYVSFILGLCLGWRRLFSLPPGPVRPLIHRVSVVIAARNEQGCLEMLLQDLTRQTATNFEVIVVDDHSDDATVAIADSIAQADSRFRCIPASGEGKKAALTTGVLHATGSIIVTTDADCRVLPGWLQILTARFADSHTQLVCGGVAIRADTFFATLQSLEFLSLIGSAGAAMALGFPIMCNGANLAFRKVTFQEVGGYTGNFHVASGDDEFLLRKIGARYPGSLYFITHPQSVVTTRAARTLGAFARQRLRWAGKWRHNTSAYTVLVALYVWAIQVTTCASLVLVLTGGALQGVAAIFLVGKCLADAWFLRPVARFVGVRWHWPAFLFLQVLYPLYVIATGLLSNVLPNNWKGRKM